MNVRWVDNIPKKYNIPTKEDFIREQERNLVVGPNPVQGRCPQCGIEIRQMMHYACPQIDCPTGLGGTRLTW